MLLSIIGATTFWFFNELNKEHSALISYPVEFEFDRDSVVIMDPLPNVVQVDVSSVGWNLFRRTLLFTVEPIRIDLENPTDIRFLTRSSLLPVVNEQLNGLNINYLLTDTLYINVERKIVKRVKLMVDSANISLENNFRVVSPISITPPEIDLIGPSTIINSLQDEYYVLVRETRIDEDIDIDVEVPLPFEDIMSSAPDVVNIVFSVDRFDRERILVPVDALNFPMDGSVRLRDSLVAVNYTVRQSLKDGFDTRDFGITADYDMLNADSTIFPTIIFYPDYLEDLVINPEVMKLRFR